MTDPLTVHLQGGLGNQLFQLSFLLYSEAITGNQIFLDSLQSPGGHSKENYFDTIFSKWKPYYDNKPCSTLRENSKLAYEDWKSKIDRTVGNQKLIGYFQRYEYTDPVRQEFIDSLTFDESVLQKYPDISRTFFIHVRGGDYIGNSFHFVDLKQHYKECINKHSGENFVIFTNDIPYATSLFPGIPIIQESEVDTLLLMSRAKGCICANSSFSWWGAYLNPNRPIYFPSKWFNDPSMDTTGLYFQGSRICQTSIPVKSSVYSIPKLQLPPKFESPPKSPPRQVPHFRRLTPSLNFLRRN
jgi:hypothetical protein